MNFRVVFLEVFFIVLLKSSVLSQSRFNIGIESQYLQSTNDKLQPHYQYSNKWGIIDQFDNSQGILIGNLDCSILNKKGISLNTCITGVLKNKTKESFLHEIYLNAKFLHFIDLNIGKQAWSPLSSHDDLIVGGFMRNANARPVPRIQIGMFDYQIVPFFNELFSIKGGLSHGILDDERLKLGKDNEAKNVQIHEKWLYVKLNKMNLQPYIGLFHGALMGGERANGDKIPVDYWSTFLGTGGSKITTIDATNAIGAHDGYWDVGLDYYSKLFNVHFYIQKPFADKTGLLLYKLRNKDYKIGAFVELKTVRRIKNISLEIFRTDYQAGYGLPDPLYPKGHPKAGQIIWLEEIENYDEFMLEVFNEITNGYDKSDVRNYMIELLDYGYDYGGRDDYNNNGLYYNGWTYYGHPMGMPLYHTYYMAKAYAPDWEPNNDVIFVNNRVKGFHIGIEGELFNSLDYILKSTYSKNYGSYGEEYIKRHSWEKDPEFFYKGGKSQWYSNLSFFYSNKNWGNLNFKTSISYDIGELYSAFGIMFGLEVQVN